jgi:quercetin dioxygenase-like cupin family protein
MEIFERGKHSVPVRREAVAQDWARRGYTCELFIDPPGREWKDFVHATNELVTVVEGRLRMSVGETTCEAGPGDEVFIPRHTRHSVKNIHGGTTRWLFGYD